jgi:UDP-N-acetyl-2-amino-2-deoxyglucuronate dehydrogenase
LRLKYLFHKIADEAAKDAAKRALGSRETLRFAWAKWAHVRGRALVGIRPIYRCEQVEWDRPGHARTVTSEILGPGRGEVLIRAIASAVSVGTERANFRLEPNTARSFPAYPGYSLAGAVVRSRGKEDGLRSGDLVAARGPHASLAVVPEHSVFAVPQGVSAEEASFILLGIIGVHGVWQGELRTGERVAVLGRGPIGQLTIQLTKALGASETVSIGPSKRHVTASLRRFADQVIVSTEEGPETFDAVQADLTIEASGHPRAISDAVRATRNGGRVVLVGSPRGVSPGFDFGELADRDIQLRGAHASTLPAMSTGRRQGQREAGELFLRLIADRKLDIVSLISTEVDAAEVNPFYRDLASGNKDWVGAIFRWDGTHSDNQLKQEVLRAPPGIKDVASSRLVPSHSTKSVALTRRPHPHGRGPRRPQRTTSGVRVAVIGSGARGTFQAQQFRSVEHATLSAVMDIDEKLARGLGEKADVPWTTNYHSILADDSIDAVFICTPHHLHAEQAIQAARSGKHIIIEKPLAHNLQDATRIVEAAQNAGVQLSTWLALRYNPEVVKAKRLVEAGILGSMRGAHIAHHLYHPPHYFHRSNSSNGRIGWQASWKTAGGGVLMTNAIHYIDWLLFLSGLKVKEVSARYDTLGSDIEVEDSIVMWLTFENGALATLNFGSCVQGFYRYDYHLTECRLWGAEGQVCVSPPRFFSSRRVDEKPAERWHTLDPLPQIREPSVEFLERFGKAILNGEPPEITGEDGLEVQAVIDAAYRSSREGCPVKLDGTGK